MHEIKKALGNGEKKKTAHEFGDLLSGVTEKKSNIILFFFLINCFIIANLC